MKDLGFTHTYNVETYTNTISVLKGVFDPNTLNRSSEGKVVRGTCPQDSSKREEEIHGDSVLVQFSGGKEEIRHG